MRTYQVLVHSGLGEPPALHLISAPDLFAAADLAEVLLTESHDGVGVEVVHDGRRVHTRGVVPTERSAIKVEPLASARCEGSVEPPGHPAQRCEALS